MLLAQTLLCKKFGRGIIIIMQGVCEISPSFPWCVCVEYRWTADYNDPPYLTILRKFLDVRDSEYSLQMIALQGADLGRPVGQWFGPNNVAQAIK